MLIHSASQVVTLTETPQRGSDLGTLNIIPDGAVLIDGQTIAEVGPSNDLLERYPNEQQLNACGRAVIPGFVDPHTHLVWAGDRAAEFEMRLEGASYMEIMAAGGGIQSTVNATRAASALELLEQTRQHANDIFRMGTTSAEAKTGYGLALEGELKQLDVLLRLDAEGPLEIFPTFLGAHAVPKEYKENPDDYVDLVVNQMLPEVKDWWQVNATKKPLPFVDVFCEEGAFSLEQSRRILEAAKALGYPLKIHADEFGNLGGVSLAAELGAVSADHLVKTSPADIEALAASGTAAVSLPCTPFGLAEKEYSPAKEMINAGALFALSSDLNPGTAWSGSMQFVIALACRMMRLTPAQALAAATINAAAAVNQAGRLGSIHSGKQADLLILNVDDYRHLAYRFGVNLVDAVIKKGKVYPLS
ncbi:MAG: imidazolonepropionase [Chloroflexi bacterium]|nr:imidazolonepropionase [Chloroflexota bacterium]